MVTHIDADKIEQELQQRLNTRMDSVRALVKSRQSVMVAREALNTAEDEDARRYQAAISAGWTVDELRGSGLPEPEKKLRTRKRAASTKKAEEVDPRIDEARLKAEAFKRAAQDKKAALDAHQVGEQPSGETVGHH